MTVGKFVNILIGGKAGQGLQTMGFIFAKSLTRSGFSVHVTQTDGNLLKEITFKVE